MVSGRRLQVLTLKRSTYCSRTIGYLFILLELSTVLSEYIIFWDLYFKHLWYGTRKLLAVCSLLSGIYFAQNQQSINGGSLGILSHACKLIIKLCLGWAVQVSHIPNINLHHQMVHQTLFSFQMRQSGLIHTSSK